MTPTELRAWMTDHGWSVRRLAAALDVQPRTVGRWRSGETPIPSWLPLALGLRALS